MLSRSRSSLPGTARRAHRRARPGRSGPDRERTLLCCPRRAHPRRTPLHVERIAHACRTVVPGSAGIAPSPCGRAPDDRGAVAHRPSARGPGRRSRTAPSRSSGRASPSSRRRPRSVASYFYARMFPVQPATCGTSSPCRWTCSAARLLGAIVTSIQTIDDPERCLARPRPPQVPGRSPEHYDVVRDALLEAPLRVHGGEHWDIAVRAGVARRVRT